MFEDLDDRSFLWFWTWVFVAVSSAGYAVVNFISLAPQEARGMLGIFRYLIEVVLPVGMCALAGWFGLEEWRGGGARGGT